MDLAKYRELFLEEATEHLAEMSRACLALEKDPANSESIDLVFRLAHSIKGMAASLEYDAITRLAHRLEDRMAVWRAQGHVDVPEGMALLFRGLEGLERLVGAVRADGTCPAPDEALIAALGRASDDFARLHLAARDAAETPSPSGTPLPPDRGSGKKA